MIYNLLMKAPTETTLAIARNPKRLSARIAITAVLHTWGLALAHHPHVHMIVPGGGLSLDHIRWIAARSNFLAHVAVTLPEPMTSNGGSPVRQTGLRLPAR